MVKSETLEGVLVVDVEETFSSDPKEKAFTSASVSVIDPIFLFFCYAKAT